MVDVLHGRAKLEFEDARVVQIEVGMSGAHPPGLRYCENARIEDLELLVLAGPASFETHIAP